jgi:hypothetical protein
MMRVCETLTSERNAIDIYLLFFFPSANYGSDFFSFVLACFVLWPREINKLARLGAREKRGKKEKALERKQ